MPQAANRIHDHARMSRLVLGRYAWAITVGDERDMNASFLARRNAAMLAGGGYPQQQYIGGAQQRFPPIFAPGGGYTGPPGGAVTLPIPQPQPPGTFDPRFPVPLPPLEHPPAGGCGPCGGGSGWQMDPAQVAEFIRWQVFQARGGSMGDGYPACPPHANPPIPISADGCPEGSIQCLQPLSVTSAALVVSGTTVPIVVTPRSMATAREFLYAGTPGDFTIDTVSVNGVDYLNGPISADRYLPAVDNRAVDWGPGFSSNTVMTITVTKITVGDAIFRGVLDASVDR